MYDATSREDILAHARKLLGKSLVEAHPKAVEYKGKGGLGQAVEKYHFEYNPNSTAEPDFDQAKLELKCTPLKALKEGSLVSKERLVLNIINYMDEYEKPFYKSSFWHKNEAILLMFYLHQDGVKSINSIFKLIRNWSIPAEDLEIFQEDYETIQRKIASGHAHELSEGDTFYLAACEKGSKAGSEMRKQPRTKILAQQRAYSIKPSYINQIILESLDHPEMFSGLEITERKAKEIRAKREEMGSFLATLPSKTALPITNGHAAAEPTPIIETFEQKVLRRFNKYIGKSSREIAAMCGVSIGSPKSMSYVLCRGMLGVKEKKIAEFEKAGIVLKTIRLEQDGRLKESMSFSTIKYDEIIEEEWEDSEWRNTLTQKFLFVVFRKSSSGDFESRLVNIFFWTMPNADLQEAEEFWLDTQKKVKGGDYEHFLKSSEHRICHVRPKAQNAKDLVLSPQRTMEKKKAYWLNRQYVLDVVNANCNTGALVAAEPTPLR